MKKNVGKTDAYIRYALGVVFLVLTFVWQWWFVFLALIMFGTGFFGTCLLYKPFKINTRKGSDK